MRAKNKETTLLDSSLISKYNTIQLKDKIYTIKGFDCGDYIQFYIYESLHFSKDKSFIDIKTLDTSNLRKKGSSPFKSICLYNAIRSNLNCQRIARCNINEWSSFITLTFSQNIKDINFANRKFNQFISNIRKLKSDFKYIAVPEFQKRGAVHYHLLSNLYFDNFIITPQDLKTGNAISYDTIYDIKYWSYGFARIDFIKDDYNKIFRYICKYMTKDIDDRLFMKKRYFNSHNLKMPKQFLVDLHDEKDISYFNNLIKDKKIDYRKQYINNYNNELITYYELKKD